MKNLSLLFLLIASVALHAQVIVKDTLMVVVGLNVQTKQVIGQVSFHAPEAGKVIVTFDGNVYSDPGDLIILAASDDTDWHINDGSTSVEAISASNNVSVFSHTRVYDVTPGDHTYYAVAHNYVETDGNGIIDLYGRLTVKYVANSSGEIVAFSPVNVINKDLTNKEVVGQVSIQAPTAGKAIVRFDGECVADPGDRIVLDASDNMNWDNLHYVSVEAIDNDLNTGTFANTRVYDISAGSHTFYAIAHNYAETDGNGKASIYGSLTVDFIPSSDAQKVAEETIAEQLQSVAGGVTMMQAMINASGPGKVLANFSGQIVRNQGSDNYLIDVSSKPNWDNQSIDYDEIITPNDDQNFVNISNSELFDVTSSGNHTFYVNINGDGAPSAFGTFILTYIPNTINAIHPADIQHWTFDLSPNPAANYITVTLPEALRAQAVDLSITDINGRVLLQQRDHHGKTAVWDLSTLPRGTYLISVKTKDGIVSSLPFEKQ